MAALIAAGSRQAALNRGRSRLERGRLILQASRQVCRECAFGISHLAEKLKVSHDTGNHPRQIGALIPAQKIAQVRQVVISSAFGARAKTLEVEPGAGAMPELEYCEGTDEVALERPSGD